MSPTRRALLERLGVAAVTATAAGCNALDADIYPHELALGLGPA
ncbi:MAG: hypothetical protein V5A28_09780 [Haloarculaceae archaeon]